MLTYVMIGDPIDHTRSPGLLNEIFQKRGIAAHAVPQRVASCQLEVTLRTLRDRHDVAGLMITTPHKSAVVEYVDALTSAAKQLQCVNCMRRESNGGWLGAQFDGAGLLFALLNRGIRVSGSRVLLLGTGNAARAIGLALAQQPLSCLQIRSRDFARAQALVNLLATESNCTVVEADSGQMTDYDIVINATTVGMAKDDPSPIDYRQLKENAVIADIVADPIKTRLAADAMAHGFQLVTGRHMASAQVPQIFEFFRGVRDDERHGT
jgi:shikimate dehydrogenase